MRIALYCWRRRRECTYEGELLGPPSSDEDFARNYGTDIPLEELVANMNAYGHWLDTGTDTGVDFAEVLRMLQREQGFLRAFGCDYAKEPEDIQIGSDKERVEWYLEHAFKDRAEALQGAAEVTMSLMGTLDAREPARAAAARQGLADIDRIGVVSQRNSRDLDRAYRRYQILQQRVLPDTHATPVPTEPDEG